MADIKTIRQININNAIYDVEDTNAVKIASGETMTSGRVVVSRGDKLIGDSGFTIGKSVPSNAVFTDTKVTSVGNHYTPSGGSSTTPSSSGTATRGSTVVMTGITKDAAGHVTGVTGYTLPASDNTDIKVGQTVTNSSNTSKRPLLLGMSSSDSTPASFRDTIDTAYAAHNAWIKPNDGILGIKQIQIADSVNLVYDNTNKCLNFNFA